MYFPDRVSFVFADNEFSAPCGDNKCVAGKMLVADLVDMSQNASFASQTVVAERGLDAADISSRLVVYKFRRCPCIGVNTTIGLPPGIAI